MPRRIGRYDLFGTIGRGATSIVHLARVAGGTKLVAVKRLHPHLVDDEALRAILIDEARLMSRISHPNVVAVLDVVTEADEIFLVLEYARGATLAELLGAGRLEPKLAIATMRDVLAGLHAAHHARDADGALLGLVHRDVTPRNVIVTTDGIGKILDFGIAKARARISTTRDGHVRGSLPYMAPEQLEDEPLTARTDIYGAGVVLWEALTGKRLFQGESEAAIVQRILDHRVEPPSLSVPGLPAALDAAILRALASDPAERFPTGLEMALALETSLAPASPSAVASFMVATAGKDLDEREARAEAEEPTRRDPSASVAIAPTPRPRSRAPAAVAVLVVATSAIAFAALRAPSEPSAITVTTTASAPVTTKEMPEEAPKEAPRETIAEPEPPPVVSATKPSSPPSPPRAPIASASAKRTDCAPYWVDDAGHRRFNRECLE